MPESILHINRNDRRMTEPTETLELGVNTYSNEPLELSVIQTSFIENVVKKINNSGTIDGNDVSRIYISEHRVCIELKNGLEFSIPVKGDKLF